MKKFLKIFGICTIMVFSFYYVEKITNKALFNSNLFKTIEKNKSEYEVNYVNAQIEGDYIIPGLYGKKINVIDSYYNMQSFKAFNEYYLIFYKEKPPISIADNKDKIIKKGNLEKNQLSFIVDNEIINKYFQENKIKADILIKHSTFKKDSFFEQINNDYLNFKRVNKLLIKNGINKEICFVENEINELCTKNNMYLVSTNIYLNGSNLLEVKKIIENGSIIYIMPSATLSDIKILIKEINYKNIEIVFLSELISENN